MIFFLLRVWDSPGTCCRCCRGCFSFGCGNCNFYRIGGTGNACPSVTEAFSGKRNAYKSKWPTSIPIHTYIYVHIQRYILSMPLFCTFTFMRTLHFFAWWGLLINHFVDFQFNFLISLHFVPLPRPLPTFWTLVRDSLRCDSELAFIV